MTAAGRRR
jgi:hypothetical protein